MCSIGLKKTPNYPQVISQLFTVFELDELYHFVGKKAKSATRENVYLMTMISSEPRQIQAFRVTRDKAPWRIQEMVDEAPAAQKHCSDGYLGYIDVVYPGEYVRNVHNKANTHNVESINADIRHFLAGLQRRSRCFFRNIETLEAVIDMFVDAYNKFGEYKMKYRQPTKHRPGNENKHLHHFRDLACSFIDFLDVSF